MYPPSKYRSLELLDMEDGGVSECLNSKHTLFCQEGGGVSDGAIRLYVRGLA